MRGGREVLVSLATLVVLTLAAPVVAYALTPSSVAPFVIESSRGLASQFGYAPEYTRNVPAFDAAGRPYIRSRSADPHQTGFVHTLENGRWVRRSLLGAVRSAYPNVLATDKGAVPTSRLVFDTSDRAYTILGIKLRDGSRRKLLLWSVDHCVTWRVATLPSGVATSESWVGHNTIDGPPLLVIERTLKTVNPHTGKLRRTLSITQPRLAGDTVVIPSPTLVSDRSLGPGDGATTATPVVTHNGRSHIVWLETTARPAIGSPVYVATFDPVTGTLGPKVLVARSRPANDGHAQPGIVVDSQGYLHVIAGAHGRPFLYVRSLLPDSAYGGWLPPVPTATTGYITLGDPPREEAQQTYLAFVCGLDDHLHITYRQWRRNAEPTFGGAVYGALSYQQFDPLAGWSAPQILVVPPYSDYAIYGQALSLDRRGRLYLSASCVSGPEGAARKAAMVRWRRAGSDGPEPPLYLRRFVLISDDNGVTWRLATTADFAAGLSD